MTADATTAPVVVMGIATPAPVATEALPPVGAHTASLQATPGQAAAAPYSGSGSIGTAVVALLVVVGLILLLARFAKRLPGLSTSQHPDLRVVGSLALGPRDRVVVVQVGQQQVMLGVGPTGTRQLHTLEQPLAEAATQRPAFAQVLAQRFRKDTP